MFDCLPSDIRQVYWKCTRNDLKVKLRLYLGQQQAHIVQSHEVLATVVSQAFGGGKSRKAPEDEAPAPKTQVEMHNAFKDVFG